MNTKVGENDRGHSVLAHWWPGWSEGPEAAAHTSWRLGLGGWKAGLSWDSPQRGGLKVAVDKAETAQPLVREEPASRTPGSAAHHVVRRSGRVRENQTPLLHGRVATGGQPSLSLTPLHFFLGPSLG